MTALSLLSSMQDAGITAFIREDGALRVRGNLAGLTPDMKAELKQMEQAVRAALILPALPQDPPALEMSPELCALLTYVDLIAACHDGTIHPAETWRHYHVGEATTILYAVETVLRQEEQLLEILAGVRWPIMTTNAEGERVLIQELALQGVERWWERRQAQTLEETDSGEDARG